MFQKLSVYYLRLRHKECNCILNLNFLEKFISCKITFKYLGVVFDNFMTWKAHVDYACQKVASRVFWTVLEVSLQKRQLPLSQHLSSSIISLL